MSYSGPDSYSYSSDGNGNSADTETYINQYGDYARSETHAYVDVHDLYIEKYTDLHYGGTETTTYDSTSETTSSSS